MKSGSLVTLYDASWLKRVNWGKMKMNEPRRHRLGSWFVTGQRQTDRQTDADRQTETERQRQREGMRGEGAREKGCVCVRVCVLCVCVCV